MDKKSQQFIKDHPWMTPDEFAKKIPYAAGTIKKYMKDFGVSPGILGHHRGYAVERFFRKAEYRLGKWYSGAEVKGPRLKKLKTKNKELRTKDKELRTKDKEP